ncbi:MAG: hypothetical protein QW410_06430 [Nitrososphaerota archaeon]
MRYVEMLTAVRCAVATILVKQHGIRPSEVARALGVSPATVTQYLKGRTGTLEELKREPALWSRIEVFSEEIAKGIRYGLRGSWGTEVEELAMSLLREMKGFERPRALEDATRLSLLRRIELEEKSAAKALELASRTGDPLVSMLLRQIASDSMRHADIISTLLRTVGEEGVSTGHDYRTLKELLDFEEQAESENLLELVRTEDPLVKALLLSIDLDERKHETVLRELLRRAGG